MNKKIVLIAIGISVVIILASILVLGLSGSSILKGKDQYRELDISIDRDDVRVGESFNLTIANVPDNANISWDLGSNNYSYEPKLTHRFMRSSQYLIHVNAKWNGGHGNGSISIPVMNCDCETDGSGNSYYDLRPRGGHGPGVEIEYYTGISDPLLEVDVSITNAKGIFEIYLAWENDTSFQYLIGRTYTGILYDIDHHEQYQISDIPEAQGDGLFHTIIIVREGHCGPWEIHNKMNY